MRKVFRVRKVVRGLAEGEAIVCPGSFSFLGDVDMDTGKIVARGHPSYGMALKGRVLVYGETKGSSGGCAVLLTLARRGLGPVALVTIKPADYNLAEGAILAGTPFVCEPDEDILAEIATGMHVFVDADKGVIILPD
jgi:predicted aconitase with swiveling domain